VALRFDLSGVLKEQTRGAAFTVAGQWRIFIAFPNIRLRLQTNRRGWPSVRRDHPGILGEDGPPGEFVNY
jgi:hypothetical protein